MDGTDFQLRFIQIDLAYHTSIERATTERTIALRALYAQIKQADAPPVESNDIPFDHPKPTISELDRKIISTLDILGYSETAFNRWCAKQFTDFTGNWREMADERKSAVYATFQSKVDQQAAGVK